MATPDHAGSDAARGQCFCNTDVCRYRTYDDCAFAHKLEFVRNAATETLKRLLEAAKEENRATKN